MSRILAVLVPAVAALAMGGCGTGNSTQTTTYYRLKAIDIFQVGATADTQTGRLAFSYLGSGNPDRVVHYNDPGADAAWGTADDKSDYYFTCAFSSSAGYAKSLDFQGELQEGLAAVYAAAPASLTGIPKSDFTRACGLNYGGQLTLIQRAYRSGADGVAGTADDSSPVTLTWASLAADHSQTGVVAPGYAGDSRDYYYRTSLNKVFSYIVTDGRYRAYEFNAGGTLKDIGRWTTAIAPASWIMPLATDVALDGVTYTFKTNTVERCTRDGAGNPLKLEVDGFSNNLPKVLGHYTAKSGSLPCAGDDVLTSKELYTLEQAS